MKTIPILISGLLLSPGIAFAYAVNIPAVVEFYSLIILIILGVLIVIAIRSLSIRNRVALWVAWILILVFSVAGLWGMVGSLGSEVGNQPIALGMHVLLVAFVFLINYYMYKTTKGL